MNRRLGIFIFLNAILFFNRSLFSMEAAEIGEKAVAESVEEALGETVEKSTVESIAKSMDVNLEDIGRLSPEDLDTFKAALKDELGSAIKRGIDPKTVLERPGEYLKNVRENFVKNLEQEFTTNLPDRFEAPEYKKLLNKFNKDVKIFPSREEFIMKRLETDFGIEPAKAKPIDAEFNELQSEEGNRSFGESTNDQELVTKSKSNIEKIKDRIKSLRDSFNTKMDSAVQKARELYDRAPIVGKTRARVELDAAGQEKSLGNRSIEKQMRDVARDRYEGSPASNEKIDRAQTELEGAQKAKIEKMRKENITNPNDSRLKTEDDTISAAKQKLRDARTEGGTQSRLRNKQEIEAEYKEKYENATEEEKKATTTEEKAAAKEKVEKAKKDLDTATSDREAAEKANEEAKKEFEEAPYERSWNFAKRNLIKGGQLFWDHILQPVVAGFAFSIPNYIEGVIQQKIANQQLLNTIQKPQRFGQMWMQIPYAFINETEPASSAPVYLGLHKLATDNVSSRGSDETLIKQANKPQFYVSRDVYDNYAQNMITDPNFPNNMVHLNSGYYFDWEGLPADATLEMIPLVQTGNRIQSLQQKLDDLGGKIRHGLPTEVYTEYREATSKYDGSEEIANMFVQDPASTTGQETGPKRDYAEILNDTVTLLQNGTQFAHFNISAVETDKKWGIWKLGKDLTDPYPYKTNDTPTIKLLRDKLIAANPKDTLLKDFSDYVLFYDGNDIVPLLVPEIVMRSQYNEDTKGTDFFNMPGFIRNPKIKTMRSLITGDLYNDQGKVMAGRLESKDLDQLIPAVAGELAEIITKAKNTFEKQQEVLQYLPVSIGSVTLEPINSKLIDNGIYVYKRTDAAIEGNVTDYVIALKSDQCKAEDKTVGGVFMAKLPDELSNVFGYLSLVSSRIYDADFNPYDEAAGNPNFTYNIYFDPEGPSGPRFYMKTGRVDSDAVTNGKAPLYSLYMDPHINPNQLTEDQKTKMRQAMTNAGKEVDETLITTWPSDPQWGLNIGALIGFKKEDCSKVSLQDTQNPDKFSLPDDLRTTIKKLFDDITTVYNTWKPAFAKAQGTKYTERELGPYLWVREPEISIMATSIDDIKNGNYIYYSPYYGEYVALSDNPSDTGRFASEFDQQTPQRYAISLSTGNVYDAQGDQAQQLEPGSVVKVIEDLTGILNSAQSVKKFRPELLKKIQQSQTVTLAQRGLEEYGDSTIFGPYKLLIDMQDLKDGRFIYADVSAINDPLSVPRATLYSRVDNFFVGIVGDLDNPAGYKYGDRLGVNTSGILSLISGAIYDRDGNLRGYQAQIKSDNAGSITENFWPAIKGILLGQWNNTLSANPQLLIRIDQLQKNLIAWIAGLRQNIRRAEEKLKGAELQPISSNIIGEINNQKYVDYAQSMIPPRYLKLYKDKYWGVNQDNTVYIDYFGTVKLNNKDTSAVISYDKDGNPITSFTGWAAENMRAYAGIILNEAGKQELHIGIDHAAIPMPKDGMIKLTPDIFKQVSAAQFRFNKIADQLLKNPNSKVAEYLTASQELALKRLLMGGAQAVAAAGITQTTTKYNFYYNPLINSYFVGIQKQGQDEYLFDLMGGYGFNRDGTARIKPNRLYSNKDKNKHDYFFVTIDTDGLFLPIFNDQEGYYTSWKETGNRKSDDGTKLLHIMTNENSETTNIVYHSDTNDYDVYDENIKLLGTYQPSSLFFNNLIYFNTRTKADTAGNYNQNDALTPVAVVWDGKENLELQYILYPDQVEVKTGDVTSSYSIVRMLPLKASGKNKYTASFKKGDKTQTLTITKEEREYKPSSIILHYLSINDGEKTLDFIYEPSVLDPTSTVGCLDSAAGEEVHQLLADELLLNYWKKCRWHLNVLVDSFGVNRLVSALGDPSSFATIDFCADPAKPVQPCAIMPSVQKDILAQFKDKITTPNRLLYDPITKRYLVKLSAETDAKQPYYYDGFDGWYVDLATGIVYQGKEETQNPDDPSKTILVDSLAPYPITSVSAKDLLILQAMLNAVVTFDKNGVQVIMYRGPQIATTQPEKKAPAPAPRRIARPTGARALIAPRPMAPTTTKTAQKKGKQKPKITGVEYIFGDIPKLTPKEKAAKLQREKKQALSQAQQKITKQALYKQSFAKRNASQRTR